jgi:hypothetical protein
MADLAPTVPFQIPYDLKPNDRLTREQLAVALTGLGFPITTSTLASMASRRTGPPFVVWGRRPSYVWAEAVSWAQGRLHPPRRQSCAADSVAQHAATA